MSTTVPPVSGPAREPEAVILPEGKDPYILDPANVREPPTSFAGSLKFLGPGMITSAAVVGSGEILTATALGAEVGFMLFWFVFVSTFVKVWVQIEMGRYSISTGKPAIDGYAAVPPKFLGRGWVAWLSLAMFIQILIGQAGVIGAAALAFSHLLPIGGDPVSFASLTTWVAIMVVLAIGIHILNRYDVIERISTVLVLVIVVFALVSVLALQGTEFAWSAGQLGEGMRFQIAAGSMGIALAMFGMTGVGAGEITAYSFWCVEKGYAAWSGPNDGSQAWVDRARGWIRVMKIDCWVSWIIYTISTVAFYMLGAAVLHPQGIIPKGTDVMITISSIFESTFGRVGGLLFLAGAGVALFKTILANAPGFSRQVVNTLAVFGALDWYDMRKRNAWMRVTLIVLVVSWGLLAAVLQSPLALVLLAGVLNALFLIAVAIATLYLSCAKIDPRVRDGKLFTLMLVISAVAIAAVGVLGLF